MPKTPCARRIAAAACVPAGAAAAPAMALPVIGLTTTNALVTFDSTAPAAGSSLMNITGLQAANKRILSIDLRPTTGMLYGISSSSNVYSLSMSGAASFVGTLSAPLVGSSVGLDFNPAADLSGAASLRVVSSSGQNYAFNVATGATTVGTPISAGLSSVAYSKTTTSTRAPPRRCTTTTPQRSMMSRGMLKNRTSIGRGPGRATPSPALLRLGLTIGRLLTSA